MVFSTHGVVVPVGSEEGETFSATVLTAADGLILLKQLPGHLLENQRTDNAILRCLLSSDIMTVV